MASRLTLHEIFCEILGTRNVYFQPPPSVQLQYPAIVYRRRVIDNRHANNNVYMQSPAYEATVIDFDPDSPYVEALSKLPYSAFDRHYEADNLNHDVFIIYNHRGGQSNETDLGQDW